MKVVVDHVRGSRRGQRQQFDDATRLSIGRHPDNDVSFDAHRDLDASSRHAELRREGRGFMLHDVGSSNGTMVAGEPMTEVAILPGQPILVEFGAGGPILQIWVGKEDTEPAPPPSGPIPHTPRQMWRVAVDEARRARRGWAGWVFARTLSGEFVYRSSWRFRILLLIALALIVGTLAVGAVLRDRRPPTRSGRASHPEILRSAWVTAADRATMAAAPMQEDSGQLSAVSCQLRKVIGRDEYSGADGRMLTADRSLGGDSRR